jgi:tetratricopeptide (TPR) repeat protein
MKNSNFAAFEKNVITRSSPLIAPVLIVAAALLLGNPSFAETIQYRVAFERVPGSEEIEAGNLKAGIRLIEDQLTKIELGSSGEILATLCAAYIVNRSLDKAERACDRAIEIKPTQTAYNNRGVLRAHKGDFAGAREDFDRVRPRQLDIYLEQLWVMDIPLMAEHNFDLVDEMLSKRNSATIDAPVVVSTAKIEDLRD